MSTVNHAASAQRLSKNVAKWGMGFTALAIMVGGASTAMAQSTASQLEEIIVTGNREVRTVNGLITAEQAAKSRSSISSEFIERQTAGQTILQNINLLPGVSFTNSDPYGSSGGNLRLRGFDGPRVSLTFDGIPLNDTGNYAIFSNQQLDGEIISRANVNLGTTDIDSPTASATGGTVNYVTRKPKQDAGILAKATYGTFDYRRFFAVVDSGEVGPNQTSAFLSASYTNYDKFKGPGELEKKQYNFRIYQPLEGKDFISVAGHYNSNRNNFYRNPTLAQYQQFGKNFENNRTYVPATFRNGTADVDATTNSDFYGVRINPSNTGNIRAQSSFGLTDSLRFTFDPYLQYVLANGGGSTTFREVDPRLRGTSTAAGVDLNGDGDTLDTVRLYTPNNTQTWRPGFTSSLLWDINDTNRLRVSYALDYGHHRQTGQVGLLGRDGNPENVFAGRDGTQIRTADGNVLRTRDRLSYAILNQVSAEYNLKALDDALQVTAGVRAPFFRRELNQDCYTVQQFAAGTIQSLNSNQYCTSAATIPATVAGTIVRAPFTQTVKYDDVLPNFGVTYHLTDEHQVYASFAQGISVPRTDDLYDIQLPNAQPEKTDAYDVGYRYQGSFLVGSAALWYNKFSNRIARAFDQDTQINITRNLGSVDLYGFDIEVGVEPLEGLTFYTSASYNKSKVKDDLRVSSTLVLATGGKKLVETPDWTYSARAQYEIDAFSIGAQVKYTGDRYATDVNDLKVGSFTVVDLDLAYDLQDVIGTKGSNLSVSITNLFDEKYLGGISSRTNAFGAGSSAPTFSVGAPRAASVSLAIAF